jgi:hypothetical protein
MAKGDATCLCCRWVDGQISERCIVGSRNIATTSSKDGWRGGLASHILAWRVSGHGGGLMSDVRGVLIKCSASTPTHAQTRVSTAGWVWIVGRMICILILFAV